MIALVALAAAHDRRDRAAALWLGMATAFSLWALLPAAPLLMAMTRRRTLRTALPVAALALASTSVSLSLLGKPHSLDGLGIAAPLGLAIVATVALALPLQRAPRPLLRTQRA